jgi:hypothetical protein
VLRVKKRPFRALFNGKIGKSAFFLHFFAKKFGHVKKKQYLCTRFRKMKGEN